MSDIGLRTYPYAGISVPSESPFFPLINGGGDEATVLFNQGYILNINAFGSSMGRNSTDVVKVSMPQTGFIADGDFYVKIVTPADSAKVTSAELTSVTDSTLGFASFHYHAKNLDDYGVYQGGIGEFYIPVCRLSKGKIEECYLRENIHWQMINFANTEIQSGDLTGDDPKYDKSLGVLREWGESYTAFGKNPDVIFKRVASYATGDAGTEQIIKLDLGEKGEIVVTTQIPAAPTNQNSFLKRTDNSEWVWVEENSVASEGVIHPWKVTSSAAQTWHCRGGEVYGQGDSSPIPVPEKSIAGKTEGSIYLKITRDTASRALTAAAIEFIDGPIPAAVPPSTQQYQYRAIADVKYIAPTSGAVESSFIEQKQFEEIRIYEELVVENGEFKLQGYEVSHRNNYQPPA